MATPYKSLLDMANAMACDRTVQRVQTRKIGGDLATLKYDTVERRIVDKQVKAVCSVENAWAGSVLQILANGDKCAVLAAHGFKIEAATHAQTIAAQQIADALTAVNLPHTEDGINTLRQSALDQITKANAAGEKGVSRCCGIDPAKTLLLAKLLDCTRLAAAIPGAADRLAAADAAKAAKAKAAEERKQRAEKTAAPTKAKAMKAMAGWLAANPDIAAALAAAA